MTMPPRNPSTTGPDQPRPPSVDKLARSIAWTGLPHPLCVEVARQAIAKGTHDQIDALAAARQRQLLTPVINATGVLLHTNLGRAPLGSSSSGLNAGASNLELSLDDGKRGSRQKAVGDLLAVAVGAEAAMVVNNCAGAVLLTLAALATGRGAVVSRGELVEIGGGFRVPDVMAQSGARLVEVGTTNRTRINDYENAIKNDGDVALAMQIHQSNYKIVGFTESASLSELATLDVPVVADIGSGLLDAACPWLSGPPPAWLQDEPAAKQSLEDGADLVLFSGDKLFGGPQAGIIAGDAELVAACGRHPLARALRPGGLVLSSLQETTLAYLNRAGDTIPFWQMATVDNDVLRSRGEALVEQSVLAVNLIETQAVPGGGTLPGVSIPSIGIELRGDRVDELRNASHPVIARVTQDASTKAKTTVLDLRTIHPDDDVAIVAALDQLAASSRSGS